jgi:type II secretory pathway component PulF
MKETIDLLGKIITNILTALYEPFGFSLLLSFLVMFFYLYLLQHGRWSARRIDVLCGDEGKKASVKLDEIMI